MKLKKNREFGGCNKDGLSWFHVSRPGETSGFNTAMECSSTVIDAPATLDASRSHLHTHGVSKVVHTNTDYLFLAMHLCLNTV